MFQTAFLWNQKLLELRLRPLFATQVFCFFSECIHGNLAHAFTLAYVGGGQDLAQVFCVVALERCFIACFLVTRIRAGKVLLADFRQFFKGQGFAFVHAVCGDGEGGKGAQRDD